MEEEIKKAITLLKNNGYFVTKIPKNLCDNAKECSVVLFIAGKQMKEIAC